MDTKLSVIKKIVPFKINGLYFIYNGEKITPNQLYFGINYPPNKCIGGRCYILYDNALRPVYLENGQQLRLEQYENVSCDYKNGVLFDILSSLKQMRFGSQRS